MNITDGQREAAGMAAQFEEITDAGNLGELDTICAADMVNHALAADRSPGLAGTREYLSSPLAARFAGETWRHRTVVSDGEYVVHHGIRMGHWPGGEFFGVHAEEGDYEREVVFMYRIRDDHVVERWAVRDDLGFLRQLGAAARSAS